MTTKLGLIALGTVLVTAGLCAAQDREHYLNGTSGLKAATLPPAGKYWLFYNFFYDADRLNDGHGDAVTGPEGEPLGFEAFTYGNAHRFLFVTDYKLWGADYSWNFVVPFISADVDIDALGVHDSAVQFGDLNVEPFVIEWRKPRYDIGFVYGFLAPTGRRSVRRPALLGRDYWTNYAGLAGTLYLDEGKTWAASILSRYEIHSERRDLDLTVGDFFSFEWGVGKTFDEVFQIGASGYASWQVTTDRGSDARLIDPLDRAFAVGPELQYFSTKHKLAFTLRHWWEVVAVDRAQGAITTLTFTKNY